MTLKDIAGMAGVSVATVSHVLNHRDNKVSPEVAARIRSIIKEVNYQPNTVAKALRSSKSSITLYGKQGVLCRVLHIMHSKMDTA